MTPARSFERLAWLTLGYTLFVILWGTAVRFTGSGAGCGDHWPACHGSIHYWPETFEAALEYGHRITSAFCGVMVIGMVVLSRRAFPRGHHARFWAAASLFFVITEGLVGAALVKLELVAYNTSGLRAFVVAVHLVNTFLFAAVILLSAFRARPVAERVEGVDDATRRKLARTAAVFAALLVVVSMMGAVTALGDTLFPIADSGVTLAERIVGGEHFLTRLRVYHPAIAVIVSFGFIMAPLWIFDESRSPKALGVMRAVAVVTLLQVAVGVTNIAMGAPGWLQIVHLALAVVLWLLVVWAGALGRAGADAPA